MRHRSPPRRRSRVSTPAHRQCRPSRAGARRRRGCDSVIMVSLIPYRSTGACPVSSASRSNTGTGSGALPETSSRACPMPGRQFGLLGDPRPHRRHAEVQGAARRRVRLGRRLAGVDQRRSDAQRAEQPEDQPVHVEQRKPVHQCVVRRPCPRLGERVEPGGDRTTAEHHTLGRPGGSRGVEHEGGRRRIGFGIGVPRPRVQPHRHHRQIRALRGRTQPGLRTRITQNVLALGDCRSPAAPEPR